MARRDGAPTQHRSSHGLRWQRGRPAAGLYLYPHARYRGPATGGRIRHPQCQLSARAPDRRRLRAGRPIGDVAPATSSSLPCVRRPRSWGRHHGFCQAPAGLWGHAPTTYFPLLVPECLLIELTETETREELGGFVAALIKIRTEAREQPSLGQGGVPPNAGTPLGRGASRPQSRPDVAPRQGPHTTRGAALWERRWESNNPRVQIGILVPLWSWHTVHFKPPRARPAGSIGGPG